MPCWWPGTRRGTRDRATPPGPAPARDAGHGHRAGTRGRQGPRGPSARPATSHTGRAGPNGTVPGAAGRDQTPSPPRRSARTSGESSDSPRTCVRSFQRIDGSVDCRSPLDQMVHASIVAAATRRGHLIPRRGWVERPVFGGAARGVPGASGRDSSLGGNRLGFRDDPRPEPDSSCHPSAEATPLPHSGDGSPPATTPHEARSSVAVARGSGRTTGAVPPSTPRSASTVPDVMTGGTPSSVSRSADASISWTRRRAWL